MQKNIVPPLVLIDAGHGGLNDAGQYTTSPTIGKRYDHNDKALDFHGIDGNGVFYEGVSNRLFANELANALAAMGIASQFVFDAISDTPLSRRTALANAAHQARGGNTIFISLHSNASSKHNARGWSIFTSEGTTRADALALSITNATTPLLLQLGYDARPSRMIRQKDFFVVRNTAMPAVLIETLFFDEINDARLLNNRDVVRQFCQAYAQGIANFFQK